MHYKYCTICIAKINVVLRVNLPPHIFIRSFKFGPNNSIIKKWLPSKYLLNIYFQILIHKLKEILLFIYHSIILSIFISNLLAESVYLHIISIFLLLPSYFLLLASHYYILPKILTQNCLNLFYEWGYMISYIFSYFYQILHWYLCLFYLQILSFLEL